MNTHNTIGQLLRGRCGRRCSCGGRIPKKIQEGAQKNNVRKYR